MDPTTSERVRALKAMQTREIADRAVLTSFASSTDVEDLKQELLDVLQVSQNKIDALQHVIDDMADLSTGTIEEP